MGQVWLATDERLLRSVAVKVVIPEAIDASQTQRLEREARAAAGVQHANVVRVFDYLEDSGRNLIVMEYVEGETLADRVVRLGKLPFDDAVDLAAQVCDGLSAAHRLHLVHRDLKPANVIITEDGLAKILDFGIAKRTGHIEATLTQTGAVLGTPQYMAPEQLGGEEIDARVDVHAAGLLLYEMLAGRSAFGGGTIAQLMFQLVSEPPDLAALIGVDVPADVVAIVDRALQKNRDDRWPDARSMAEALRVALYGDVIRSRRTPTPTAFRMIVDGGARITPHDMTGSGPPLPPSTASVSLFTEMRRMPRRTMRRTAVGIAGMAVLAAVSLSRIVSGLADPAPSSTRTVRAVPVVAPVRNRATESSGTPTIDSATGRSTTSSPEAAAENLLRMAFSNAVLSRWKLFSRPVSAELGTARMSNLRADFIVRVDQAGRLTDMRPVRLSGVATFDDNVAAALQNVDRVRVGSARRAAGWEFRVQFTGKGVRVRGPSASGVR